MDQQHLKLRHNLLPKWLWMIPILLLSTTISTSFLTADALWGDEVENLRNMGIAQYGPHTFDKFVEQVGLTRWPPAYNIISYPWIQLTGISEFALRSLSILLGIIAIAFMYQFSKLFTNATGGLLGAIFLGTSPFFVFYMHEMRGYVLYILISIVAYYTYLSAIQTQTFSRRHWVGLTVSMAIFIYTHYIALLMAITIGLYHLLIARHTQNWRKVLSALIFAGLTYLPWILVAVLNTISEANDKRGLNPIEVLQQFFYGFGNGLPILFLLILLYTLWQVQFNKIKFLWFCLAIFTVLALGLNFVTDYLLHIRHTSGVFVIVIVLVVIGITHLYQRQPLLAALVTVIWLGAGLIHNQNTDFFDSLRGSLYNIPLVTLEEAVELASECANEKDAVIAHLHKESHMWNQLTIEYYFHGYPYRIAMLDYMIDLTDGLRTSKDFGSFEDNTLNFIENADHLWIIRSKQAHQSTKLPILETILAKEYEYCNVFIETPDIIGYVYQNDNQFTCEQGNISTQTLPACVPILLTDTAD